jgi:hypothetical protein
MSTNKELTGKYYPKLGQTIFDMALKGCRLHSSSRQYLHLSYMNIVGIMPPHVGNLSFLASLSIENNNFHGSLPNELSHLYRLQHLSFEFNNFSSENCCNVTNMVLFLTVFKNILMFDIKTLMSFYEKKKKKEINFK